MDHNRLEKELHDEFEEYTKPEKDKINVYDNDEVYMLNDDKDNPYMDENYEENLNEMEQKDDNFEEEFDMELNSNNDHLNADPMRNISNISEDETVRNKIGKKGTNNNENVNQNANKIQHVNGNNNMMSKKVSDRSKSMSNLITLKYISVCQCCKENFNSSSNTPYLLKCGHFFCRSCLVNNFTEEDGTIICPDDGVMANSLNELKLLNNLIIDKTINQDEEQTNSRETGYCDQHPGQKLSHYVEDTREVICVYCAFNKFKKNPKYEIKEIKDKCQEIIGEVDKILSDNQHYVEILQQTLKEIKDNKVTEEERVSNLYDEVIKYLEEKKSELFENINNIFATNADKLSEKLDYFSSKMEVAEELKTHTLLVMNNDSSQINQIMQRYTQFMRENSDSNKLNLELTEYKFSHDDENKLIKYLNNFGDLKSKNKYIRFLPKIGATTNIQTMTYNPQSLNENANLKSSNSNMNLDYQFRNLNIVSATNNLKKNYESNYTSSNKYPNLYQNEILNTSELLNENNEYLGGRISTHHKQSNYSKDLSTPEISYKPNISKNFQNLNRIETNSRYSYNRNNNEPSYDPMNRRDFNFSASSYNLNRTPETGKNKK